jgi:malonyl-CoA/methylmalonyl-CoA synthetase
MGPPGNVLCEALKRHSGAGTVLVGPSGQPDAVTSWDRLWEKVRAMEAALGGTRPGERIALVAEPSADWVAALCALWSLGLVAVPLSPHHPERELASLLDDAEVSAVLVDAEGRTGAHLELSLARLARGERVTTAARPREPNAPADLALLLYTSGTTGRPKGAMLRAPALLHQSRLLARAWQLDRATRLVHALPLHHMHGLAIALLPCLVAGAEVELMRRFDARALWEALARCNTLMAVPTMYQRLVDAYHAADEACRSRWCEHGARLRLATSGSAPLSPPLALAWQAIGGAIPLERYGMTETGVICSGPYDAGSRRLGSVGPPLPTVELRIVNDDGVAEGEPGEVWLRGPSLFSGYWRLPDESARAFAGDWFKTGDVGALDADGWLTLSGRASVDIIKSGGFKISAIEIENVLGAHPEVHEAAVVGLADAAHGERVVAVVVAAESSSPDDLAARLEAWCRERLIAYKVPRRFVTLAELPRNALGKVQKQVLKSTLEA